MRAAMRVLRLLLTPVLFLPELILLGLAVYLAVRFTVRDLYVPARYILYMPTAPVAAGAVFAIVMRLFQRRRRVLLLPLCAALGAVIFCVARDEFRIPHSSPSPAGEGKVLKMVAWNIQGTFSDWSKVGERIRREDPDLILLTEANIWQSPGKLRTWAREFPGYRYARIEGPLTVLVKGNVIAAKYEELNKSRYLRATVEVDGVRINVIVFHPFRYIRRDSEAIFRQLAEFIDAYGDREPLIVSGDFNTPPSSAYLDRIEARMSNAFRTAGNGFNYSWPREFPLIAIDHTFVNGRIRALSYRIERADVSDHCMQIMEFAAKAE